MPKIIGWYLVVPVSHPGPSVDREAQNQTAFSQSNLLLSVSRRSGAAPTASSASLFKTEKLAYRQAGNLHRAVRHGVPIEE